ncbi:B12-binding domain-containing radical SAM protein [Chloroflexota bacterium]
MKILFVYPNVTRQISPQLGICSIAAVADQLGHECDLYDLTIIPAGKEFSTFTLKLESFEPDLLAVSCRSNEWAFLDQLFRYVKVDDKLKVFGGPHATVAPEEVIQIADIVVIGEGEDTFSELLKKIDCEEDFTKIAGCWIKEGSKIIKNEMRNLISDLDKLPVQYWKIFDDIHYYNSYIKTLFQGAKVVGTFEGSRGCPYACTYCTNDYVRTLYRGKGKWRREKSIERIVQEVCMFRDEYGLDCIYWIDEVLLTSFDRLKRFRDLYSSEIGVPFVFMERPENMIDEKVCIIKQAGAQRVSIGIESGDENLRKNLLGRHHSNETIISAFKTAKKYNLTTHAFTMVGYPDQDRHSIKETYRLIREAQPDTVQTSIFYPLRGTKLYEKVVEEGLFDPKTPMPKEYYSASCLNYPKRWKEELLRWEYFLANYNSRFPAFRFLVIIQPSQLVFRIFALAYRVCKTFKKEGFNYTLKAIHRRISKMWVRDLVKSSRWN